MQMDKVSNNPNNYSQNTMQHDALRNIEDNGQCSLNDNDNSKIDD